MPKDSLFPILPDCYLNLAVFFFRLAEQPVPNWPSFSLCSLAGEVAGNQLEELGTAGNLAGNVGRDS